MTFHGGCLLRTWCICTKSPTGLNLQWNFIKSLVSIVLIILIKHLPRPPHFFELLLVGMGGNSQIAIIRRSNGLTNLEQINNYY